jgi:hypothetical protein
MLHLQRLTSPGLAETVQRSCAEKLKQLVSPSHYSFLGRPPLTLSLTHSPAAADSIFPAPRLHSAPALAAC